jgi:hypothetical protein
MVIKVKSSMEGGHIVDRIFMGPDKDHLELSGILNYSVDNEKEQWIAFSNIMHDGVLSPINNGDTEVIFEGRPEVFEYLDSQ